MRPVAPDRPLHFIRACQENTSLLTSLLEWLDSERDKLLEGLAMTKGHDEILQQQGRVLQMATIRTLLGNMVRSKADAA